MVALAAEGTDLRKGECRVLASHPEEHLTGGNQMNSAAGAYQFVLRHAEHNANSAGNIIKPQRFCTLYMNVGTPLKTVLPLVHDGGICAAQGFGALGVGLSHPLEFNQIGEFLGRPPRRRHTARLLFFRLVEVYDSELTKGLLL